MTSNRSVSEMVLKPCPFCGGESELSYVTGMRALMRVSCGQCGARIERERDPFNETSEIVATENAIAAWNTRASSKAQSDDVVERVEQAIRSADEADYRTAEVRTSDLRALIAVGKSAGGK